MTPVHQTVFGFPRGNCQAACLASIFNVPIDAIPDDPDMEWDSRYSLHVEWLRAQGIFMLNFPGPIPFRVPGYLIASMPSQNHQGKNHAVVWKDGRIVHDPNPNNAPYTDSVPLGFTCFCLIDPAAEKPALRSALEGEAKALEECERLRDALMAFMPLLEEFGKPSETYGTFMGGDPRDFRPDEDACSKEEIERHRLACEAWDRGECTEYPHSGIAGSSSLTIGTFGYGTFMYADPTFADQLKAFKEALGESARTLPEGK